jgi:ATP-dependent Lhr-like helicase
LEIYDRLAPWIQDYIYRAGWQALRPVQIAAGEALFSSQAHVLLSTGTASGKTEAAFLPALTLLNENPASSVGILYVSPLKALINDQFVRLQGLLEEGGIPVTKWHGDASASGKARLLRNPEGVLQITPESLEGLLTRRAHDIPALFGDLRFVVVDEVHHFMANERGIQLQCLLERLERTAGCAPRRIGLSATLGDTGAACAWLSAGTGRQCLHPSPPEQKRRLLLRLDYTAAEENGKWKLLYEQTLGKKTIVFTIERVAAELACANLKRIAARHKTPDVYRVHHGSLATALREETEREIKRSEQPLVTAATVTLELGLDIGDMDRVVQFGLSPLSASSFTQRIGRCGRKGQPAELLFLLQSELESDPAEPLTRIDWDFIKCIAIIQLYLEEKWVEPIAAHTKPFSLCFHQTMCVTAAAGEIAAARLAQEILTLPAFSAVTQEEYRTLLQHLMHLKLLQKGDAGGLMLGAAADLPVSSYDFLSVFRVPDEFQVRHKGDTIGTVTETTLPGERLVLGGKCWAVLRCDEEKKIITVLPSRRTAETKWKSFCTGNLHAHLLERMRRVLAEDAVYAYLNPHSAQALAQMRGIAARYGLATQAIFESGHEFGADLGGDRSTKLFPWLGTPALQALCLALKKQGVTAEILPGGFNPVYLDCGHKKPAELRHTLRAIQATGICSAELEFEPQKLRPRGKFDAFLPEKLLREETAAQYLDCEKAMEWLANATVVT